VAAGDTGCNKTAVPGQRSAAIFSFLSSSSFRFAIFAGFALKNKPVVAMKGWPQRRGEEEERARRD
jgi:hypothetical protein